MALHAQAPAPALRVVPTPGTAWSAISVSLVVLCAAVTVASFVTSDPTRNDFERFGDLRLLFLFFALFAGLCAAYVAAYAQRHAVPQRILLTTALLCAGLLLASFPVGSKDVFGYAFLGKMWGTLHVNPYSVSPLEFKSDPWFPSLVGTLRRPLSVYGPLFMWQGWVVNAVAGPSLWLAVWLHKTVAMLEWLAALWLAQRILAGMPTDAPRSWLLLLLAWNPLLLFEAAGTGHNDTAMALLLLAAIWCWSAGRCGAALACVALSFWYKWYSLILVPAFFIETVKASGLRAALRQALILALWMVVCGVVLLGPLPGALPSIVGQFLHPEKMHGIFPNELSPPLALLFWGMRAAGLFATDRGFDIFNATRLGLFVAAIAAICVRQWRAAPSVATLTESCTLVGLAFFMLLVTQLWPWHMLTVVACALVRGREPFTLLGVMLSVLAVLSNFLTFGVATLMFGLVVGAVWVMRRFGGYTGATPA